MLGVRRMGGMGREGDYVRDQELVGIKECRCAQNRASISLVSRARKEGLVWQD